MKQRQKLLTDEQWELVEPVLLPTRRKDIEMISPIRSNRKQKTQDGRPPRRYRRRWKVEYLFAWMQNY